MDNDIQQRNILNLEQIDLRNNAKKSIESLVKACSSVENYDQYLENAVVSLAQALGSCDTFDYRQPNAFIQFAEIIKSIVESQGLHMALKPIELKDSNGRKFNLPIISVSNQNIFNQHFITQTEVSADIVLMGHSDKINAIYPEFYKLKVKIDEVSGEKIFQGRGANDMLAQVAAGLISMILAKDSNLTYAMVLLPDEEIGCRWSEKHLPKIVAKLVIDLEPTGNMSGVFSNGMVKNHIIFLDRYFFKNLGGFNIGVEFLKSFEVLIKEIEKRFKLNIYLSIAEDSINISINTSDSKTIKTLAPEINLIIDKAIRTAKREASNMMTLQRRFVEQVTNFISSAFPDTYETTYEALTQLPDPNNPIYKYFQTVLEKYYPATVEYPKNFNRLTSASIGDNSSRLANLNTNFASATAILEIPNSIIFSFAEYFGRHTDQEAASIGDIVKLIKILLELLKFSPNEN